MSTFDGPNIVRNGLVFYLDPANKESYPGSGISTTDLIDRTKKGVLLPESFFSSENSGIFNFNGSNRSIELGSGFAYTSFTIALWVNCGSTQVTYADIFDNNHTGTRNFVLQQNVANLNQYSFGLYTQPTTIINTVIQLSSERWTYLCFTFSPSTRVINYVDGLFVSQSTTANGSLPVYSSEYLRIGRWGGGGRYWNGKMGIFKMYNRELSANEILQNFNATKARYVI